MEASIYLRISYDPRGEQLGVERQEELCRALCERNGWTVREVFVDNDLSATTGVERPAFERLLKSRPDAIVVWHIDRLVRVSEDLERVLALKVNVHAVTSGHIDLSNPAGRAVARTVVAWATYEGEQKGERQRAASRQRAQQGRPWWPQRPFGFEMDGSHRQDEKEALRGAYGDLLAGKPLMRIADDLNEKGFRTNRGNRWRATTLLPILRNPRNAGIRTYKGEEVGKAAWEPIVPEETWRAADRLLARRAKSHHYGNGRREALLTGVVECDLCVALNEVLPEEERLPTTLYQARRKGQRIYRCRRSHHSKDADELDSIIASAAVARMTLPHPYRPYRLGSSKGIDVGHLEMERDRLKRRADELAEDYYGDPDGPITRSQFKAASASIKRRMEELESQIADAGEAGIDGEDELSMAEFADQFFEYGTDKQRQIIRYLFPQISVAQRGKGKRTWQPGEVTITAEQWCPDEDMQADLLFRELVTHSMQQWAEREWTTVA